MPVREWRRNLIDEDVVSQAHVVPELVSERIVAGCAAAPHDVERVGFEESADWIL